MNLWREVVIEGSVTQIVDQVYLLPLMNLFSNFLMEKVDNFIYFFFLGGGGYITCFEINVGIAGIDSLYEVFIYMYRAIIFSRFFLTIWY